MTHYQKEVYMIRRLAHLLGLQKKDDSLSHRFAKIRQKYAPKETESEAPVDVVSHMRTGLNMRTVVGAEKTTGEILRKNLLESYAKTAEDRELVGSSK